MWNQPSLGQPLCHRPSTDAMRRVLTSFRAVTGLVYDVAPPRTLNELPDQGLDSPRSLRASANGLTCLFGSFSLRRRREVYGPSGSCLPSCVCSASFGESRPRCGRPGITEGIFWATQARGVERCVWEQAAWSEWATADVARGSMLRAFDHVAYQKLIDAAVRTRFSMRQLKLLLPLCQARGA